MIHKYVFGKPFPTEAVVTEVPAAEGEPAYGTIETKEGFCFTYVMEDTDIVYGLGEANRGLNKRGYCYISDCTDEPNHTEDKRSLYGAHNFIIVSGKKTFGLFFDYPSSITFDIGYTRMDTLKVSCGDADLNLFVIDGDSPYDIVKQFRKIIGRSYIPPKFAFGFGQSRWGYKTNEDFRKDSMRLFGYAADHGKMKGLHDLFLHARTLYAYRVNSGGQKAENTFAVARCSGVRGNDLKIVIQANVDDDSLYDVSTYLGTMLVDSQTVSSASDLAENAYVKFKQEAELAVTAATPLSGGTNGTADGAAHQKYLDKIESYSYNTMGVAVTEDTIKKLYVSFNRRLRDEMGIKFQLVLYQSAADYMGTISVENKTLDEGWPESSLADYTQTQLAQGLDKGQFLLHRVNADIRVLEDINSMVTTTDTEGDIFKDNQVIRVIDQLGNDDAALFQTKYLGVVPNKASGRTSLWSDLKKLREDLQAIGAIENFTDEDLTVEQGDSKRSVVVTGTIEVVNAMGRLYMTNVVK